MLQADKVTVSKHLRILLPPSRQSKSQQETQIVEERGSRDSMAMVEKPRGSSKLDKPPVKLACLSCRRSRIRCDGREPCSNCTNKSKPCVYTKSKRGGPRQFSKKAARAARQCAISKLPTPLPEERPPEQQSVDLEGLQPDFHVDFLDDLIAPMILPGAGLQELDTDRIFDDLFGGNSSSDATDVRASNSPPELCDPICRAYRNDTEILNAYYIYIHSYFPVLPPPASALFPDDPLPVESSDVEPASPLALALLAILTLIPHPQDPDPRSEPSTQLRRLKAQMWAELAMESIEIDTEMLTSSTSPSEALSEEPSSFRREAFHPHCQVELEGLLAYLVLSIYEYAQRGNIAKMRNRASQAYDAAIQLSLQEDSEGSAPSIFCEARRRAWWMTYATVLQGSIVSSLPPIIQIERRNFRTPLPFVQADADAWARYLDAQQLILQCTQYTVALKRAIETQADLTSIHARMEYLDRELDGLIERYSWDLDPCVSTGGVDSSEALLATSLKAQAQIKLNSARIKLHRYRAFHDAPIFTQRHCDLQKANPDDIQQPKLCCSGTLVNQSSPSSSTSTSNTASTTRSPTSSSVKTNGYEKVPFGSPESAKICMKSALQIGLAFEALPYPNPSQVTEGFASPFLSLISMTPVPRTMPAFACCAMQASYALLMLCRKSQEWNRSNPFISADAQKGLEELLAGLTRVLDALNNYSIAFEALGGMRAQVEDALEKVERAQNRRTSFTGELRLLAL